MKSAIFFAILLIVSLQTIAQTQTDKKSDTQITITDRVTDSKDGSTQVTVKVLDLNSLTEAERETKIKAVMDSVKATNKDNHRISVTIDDNKQTSSADKNTEDRVYKNKKQHKVYRFESKDGEDVVIDTREMRENMKQWAKDMKPKFKKMEKSMEKFGERMSENWSDNPHVMVYKNKTHHYSATIRSLNAFPNNPDKNELNIRFHAPLNGDVIITVTDTKGKQVARKEIKGFGGEFVGQIDIGKDPKGTYFVMVTQNEDGAVKRVVID
jgi:hypothetical protein